MTFSYLIKQPWFQGLLAFIVAVSLGIGIYYWGKSAGRAANQTEFDLRQEKLLKQSQDAIALAEKYKSQADIDRALADKLRDERVALTKDAQQHQNKIVAEQQQKMEELNQNYEQTKNSINADASACDRCRDLCERTNRFADANPELAITRCNTADCAATCGSQ